MTLTEELFQLRAGRDHAQATFDRFAFVISMLEEQLKIHDKYFHDARVPKEVRLEALREVKKLHRTRSRDDKSRQGIWPEQSESDDTLGGISVVNEQVRTRDLGFAPIEPLPQG